MISLHYKYLAVLKSPNKIHLGLHLQRGGAPPVCAGARPKGTAAHLILTAQENASPLSLPTTACEQSGGLRLVCAVVPDPPQDGGRACHVGQHGVASWPESEDHDPDLPV